VLTEPASDRRAEGIGDLPSPAQSATGLACCASTA